MPPAGNTALPPHPPAHSQPPCTTLYRHEAGLAELVGDRPVQTLGFPRGERGARPGAAGGCGFSGRIGTMEEIAPPASPPSPPGFRRCRTQRPRALPCVSTGAAPRQHPQLLSDSPKVAPELAAGPQVCPPPPNQVTSRGRIPPPAAPPPPVPQDPPPRQQWGALRLSRLPAVGTPREAPVGLSRDLGEMHQGPPLPPPGLAHSRGVGAPGGSTLAQVGLGN